MRCTLHRYSELHAVHNLQANLHIYYYYYYYVREYHCKWQVGVNFLKSGLSSSLDSKMSP